MNNIFVAAPSYRDAQLAQKFIGVPHNARYLTDAWQLRGHHEPTVYVVSLGFRDNDGWHPFGNPKQYDKILDIMQEAKVCKATVKQVVLP
jgi:hypothetical protein